MLKDNACNAYYELKDIWGSEPQGYEKERLEKTLKLIPQDVKSILDVGCGDGIISNVLFDRKYEVTALDSSREALKHVKAKSIHGSSDSMDFPNASFDLVLCAEVLEHLPEGVYEKTLEEVKRLSRKYIIVSTPNKENLHERYTKCAECGCQFHIYRHLRSFNEEKLKDIFPGYVLKNQVLCGQMRKRYSKSSLFFRQNLGNTWASSNNALCPQCQGKEMEPFRWNPWSITGEVIHRVMPGRKLPNWVISLYIKE